MQRIAVVLSLGSAVLGSFAAQAAAAPLGTVFTYQGRLELNGQPAGPVDLEFTLFDAVSGGNMVAGPLAVSGVNPDGGLFSVDLDFGAAVWDGQARWLEIAVAAAGSGAFETLSPRQRITAAPYALYALDGPGGAGGFWAANGTHIHNTNAGDVGIGTTTPAARLDVKSPSAVKAVIGNVSPGFSADLVTGGIICSSSTSPSAQGMYLSAFGGVPRVGSIRIGGAAVPPLTFQIDNVEKMRIAPDGNVGIGTTSPAEKLHVAGTTSLSGPTSTRAVVSQRTYDSVSPHSATAELELAAVRDFLFGGGPVTATATVAVQNTAGGLKQLSLNAQDAGMTLGLHTQSVERMTIAADGNIGIGTATPAHKLQINGANALGIERSDAYTNTQARMGISSAGGGGPGLRISMSSNDGVSFGKALFISETGPSLRLEPDRAQRLHQ